MNEKKIKSRIVIHNRNAVKIISNFRKKQTLVQKSFAQMQKIVAIFENINFDQDNLFVKFT